MKALLRLKALFAADSPQQLNYCYGTVLFRLQSGSNEALLRLCSGSVQALVRLYAGSMKALLWRFNKASLRP
jgi:hypothetical protein